jgi:hypothetical protein
MFAAVVATANSACAFRYNAVAAFALAVSALKLWLAAANFLACASAAFFLAASTFFAASISAKVGFGAANAGTDGIARATITASEIALKLFFTITFRKGRVQE